ncbi:glycolate dehydrogenase, iron-sulfur subunit GlcF [Geomicrobium sp. JCM 19037]|uniref:(Fe-S)-binding protein n=1 Tax=Geomicrobium sp. JCM 19037 TaxID=1460634 RepID=UPI00045F3BE8|nr:(Fe-S)-binding protein [Geomicrobium sp. JCM 19037]GAK04917.1 glycolate dehydrogenase, iron-sulfur subunit GlcF [Geomicrobium sp. JCM 19037]
MAKLAELVVKKADNPKGNYLWEDAPDEDKFSACVHCGMCLEACPTYQELGHEHQSPRGRVHSIVAVAKGEIELNEAFADPVFTCLDCRACETACPAGVQVGALIEEARGQVRQAVPLTGVPALLNKLFLRGIFPHTKRMHTLGSLTKLYQKSGVQFAVRKTRAIRILPEHLSDMEAIMPPIGKPVLKTYPDQLPAKGTAKQSAAMFTGCIMDVMFSDVNEATVRVLQKNGHDVHIPKNQKCCGALHVHAGDRAMGKKLARDNIDAFMNEDHIVVNAAGCGCALKEYPELLQNDEEYREKAEAFSERVIDVSKYLYDYGYEPPKAEINKRITYHDACHLAHGQQVWDEPRELLEQIPGVEMVHLPDADRCCGSAGIYNLTNPDMAGRLLKRKIDDVPENVEMISMGNPGCMLQIALGVKKYGRSENVVHTMQLLDWAYEKEEST